MARKRKRRLAEGSSGPELKGIALLLSEVPAATCDLHGHNASQARARLTDFLRTEVRHTSGAVVHVITGRGTRSIGAPVLPDVVRTSLTAEHSDLVVEWAGLPGGGGVAVRLA